MTAVVLLGGGRVLTGGADGAVKLWAPAGAGGRLLKTFRPPAAALRDGGTERGTGPVAIKAIVCVDSGRAG